MRRGENRAIAVLVDVLPAELVGEVSAVDVRVVTPDGVTRVRPTWVGEGFPADVRRALALGPASHDEQRILVARRMSQGAQKLLVDAGVSWADEAGYAEIRIARGVYISRREPAASRSVAPSMSWSPSAGIVVEYVLSCAAESAVSHGEGTIELERVAHIATATSISNSQVAKVLTMLDEVGFTAKRGAARGPSSRRELRDAGQLMSAWIGNYSRMARRPPSISLHVSSRDPREWVALVGQQLGARKWGISGWAAADLIAQSVTHIPDTVVYVSDDDFASARAVLSQHPDITEVDRGGRIELRAVHPSLLRFVSERQGAPVMSPVRVCADLVNYGGRGIDVAEHVREVVLGF